MAQFTGTKGNDVYNGTAFDDVIRGGGGADTLRGGAGKDSIFGDEGSDRLEGGEGDDRLDGGSGSDTLIGDAGRDVLTGGQGGDILDGGAGTDAATFSGLRSEYSVTTVKGVTTVKDLRAKGPDGADSLTGIERLVFADGRVVYLTANRGPVAASDTVRTSENSVVTGSVLSNDTDSDFDSLSVTAVNGVAAAVGQPVTLASGARLTLQASGSYSYDPDGQYEGLDSGETALDSFTYVVSDGHGGTSTATVTITIDGANDAPVAEVKGGRTDEDTVYLGSVLASDADGEPLTYAVVGTTPAGVTFNEDGTFEIVPLASDQTLDSGESRDVTFDYVANDGTASSTPKTVTITINGANDAPIAVAKSGSTDEDTIYSGSVLASDADGEPLTYGVVGTTPAEVTFSRDGTFQVAPLASDQALDSGESRTVTFDYAANDGTVSSTPKTVTITINGANDAPMAVAKSGSTDEDTIYSGSVLASDADGEPLTYGVVGTTPAEVKFNRDGTFEVAPLASDQGLGSGESRTVTFDYAANDATVSSTPKTVTIVINGVNDAPIAEGVIGAIDEETAYTGTLRATDAEGDELSYALIGPRPAGVTFNSDGTFKVVPVASDQALDSGESRVITFDYTVNDGEVNSTPQTVTITINGVNDAPEATAVDGATSEDITYSGAVRATDVDGEDLTFALVGTAPVTFNPDGTFEVAPLASDQALGSGGSRVVTFDYVANDGTVNSAAQTVTITINGVNDAPIAEGVIGTIDEETAYTGKLRATDVEGDELSYALIGPRPAGVTFNSDGTFKVAPVASDQALDSGESRVVMFDYTVNDGEMNSTPQTVTVTINGVNDAPIGAVPLSDQAVGQGDALQLTLPAAAFTDPDGDALSYTATLESGAALPSWLLFDAATRTFSGTPGTVDIGTLQIKITASDGEASASDVFALDVFNTNDAPSFVIRTPDQGAITRVSTDASGVQGNGSSVVPTWSADGTKVLFYSSASNLVAGDTNGREDVFIKDLATGAVTRVSTTADGGQANGSSQGAMLSADGTKLVFRSDASNLVTGDTNGVFDIFVKDLATGAITRVSTDAGGAQATGVSSSAVLSGDGSKVVFRSDATNLVADDTNARSDLFLKDLVTGEIKLVSSAADGTQSDGISSDPILSADGSKVAFYSNATNLVAGDTNGLYDIFLKDVDTGAITRVSTDSGGTQANGNSFDPFLSADGSKLIFSSDATNLVAGDTNGKTDIFIKDLATGAMTRVSTDSSGGQVNNSSSAPSLSADGTILAFYSNAANLVAADTNNNLDVFVKDLTTGVVTRVSTDAGGVQARGHSNNVNLSADGTLVAFQSNAPNLVPGDSNNLTDVFVKELPSDMVAGAVAEDGKTYASGRIGFTDSDLSDTHVLSTVANASGYVGTFTASIGDAASGDGKGEVAWSFQLDNSSAAVQALNGDDTLVQSYTLTLDDGQGGTIQQVVTIAIAGNAEPPTAGNDNIVGTAGNDVIDLLAGDDMYNGRAGDDDIRGGDGVDILFGGVGNDVLRGGGGPNAMYGGEGDDTVVIEQEHAGSTDTIDGESGFDTVQLEAAYSVLGSEDNLLITGGQGYEARAFGIERIVGSAGSYTFDLRTYGSALTMELGAGNDYVLGTSFADVFSGGLGHNNLNGGGGDDIFVLTIDGPDEGVDGIFGEAGVDTVQFEGVSRFVHETDNDNLFLIEAGVSHTQVAFLSGVEKLIGSEMFDGFHLSNASYALTIDGRGGDDRMFTGSGDDQLSGGEGNDFFLAGAGNDTISGGDGADRISGGAGADSLTGGAGADVFAYAIAAQSGGSNVDRIFGFVAEDAIDLSSLDANTTVIFGQDFTFIGQDAFTGVAGQLRVDPNYVAEEGWWAVLGDVNGDGFADLYIQVQSPVALTAGDFLF